MTLQAMATATADRGRMEQILTGRGPARVDTQPDL
jgi:hypothetical protein